MFRVEYYLDGVVEDIAVEKSLTNALALAADWQEEVRDDVMPPQSEVTVTEIRLIATFPLGKERK